MVLDVLTAASPDPDSFLSDMSTMGKVDQNMNSLLQDFQAQQANLADLQRAARDVDDQILELGTDARQLRLQLTRLALALLDQRRCQLLEPALMLAHRLQQRLAIPSLPRLLLSLHDGRLAGREGLAKRCRQVVLVFFHLVSLSKPNMSA